MSYYNSAQTGLPDAAIHARAPFPATKSRLANGQPDIMMLPPETLLHVAGYLSNKDVEALVKAFPRMETLVVRKAFRRWQRLLGEFITAQDDSYEAIEREQQRRQQAKYPAAASSLVAGIREAQKFENTILPWVLSEMGISPPGNKQMQLDAIFLGLQMLGKAPFVPFAPLVDGTDVQEGSKRLRSSLNAILPVECIISLLPLSVSRNVSLLQSPVFDGVLLTAYLLFTKLRPEGILHLLPRHSQLGYINEQALAEYLSYILLFLKALKANNALWGDVLQSSPNPTTDSVRWSYTNGSPVSEFVLQILRRRIEAWFATYYGYRPIPSPNPQPSILTPEQRNFVYTDIIKGQIFKVRAYAGTGKTKCLVDYASRRPGERMLYVAYNRQAKMDADVRFKDCINVDCKTLHSVAFNALSIVNPVIDHKVKRKPPPVKDDAGSSRRGKFSRIVSAPVEDSFLRGWDIEAVVDTLHMTSDAVASVFTTPYDWEDKTFGGTGFSTGNTPTVGTAKNPKNSENLARVVATGIDRFCQSRDAQPGISHLSPAQCRSKLCNPELAVKWLKILWGMIIDGQTSFMTHDCYLKMFSLTSNREADVYTFGKYDIVMFDEAQDANPCMANIILRQREAAAIIIIGDPYQMIYGFRGARNECFDDTRLPPDETFRLTKSFRFGQEIADVANLILGTIGERNRVHGTDDVPSPSVFLPPASKLEANSSIGKHTVIFRSNTELVKYFFSSFAKNPHKTMFLKTSAANASTAIIPLLRSGYHLYKGRTPKHPRLKGISSFDEAKSYLQREDGSGSLDTDEVDIQAITLVVGMEHHYKEADNNNGSFLDVLEASAGCIVDVEAWADVILTTAHQAKGLEWDNVIIANDFITTGLTVTDAGDQWWCREAANVLYVACTRARKRLQLSNGLAQFFSNRMGTSRFFLSPTALQTWGPSACPCCRGKHPSNTFLSEHLQDIDNNPQVDTSDYFLSMPSPCVGLENLTPRRDPLASDGWIEYTKQPLNPIQIPRCIYLPAIACLNCIIAWRGVRNETHSDLFRFAEGIKGRLGFSSDASHSDFKIFWARRFPPNMPGRLVPHGYKSFVEVYQPWMRMDLEQPYDIGRVTESLVAWSDYLFEMANTAGVEYDDDDLEDYIKSCDDSNFSVGM
ncbi:hypothetical protein DRE_04316 [Drechslerella stenobrocha 248]|uniref:DNA 3'-5' helicase n=1 Tax=Drechslerella stenobrocha 248 TaxID=1043628 RepID=W7I252_9PEZI|nr:hypothetical protein DRE_04316 [Drechslerella stenobrocha 248]